MTLMCQPDGGDDRHDYYLWSDGTRVQFDRHTKTFTQMLRVPTPTELAEQGGSMRVGYPTDAELVEMARFFAPEVANA